MAHFFVPPENICGEEVRITGDDVKHIRNVLRMKSGETVSVSCGRGLEYQCKIKEVRETEILLAVEEVSPSVTELPVQIVLFQSLPKRDKMEFVIQKAVELGVSEIVPVRSRRCIVKLDAKKEVGKLMRWRGIAESAAKQSGRGFVPQIHDLLDYDDAIAYAGQLEVVLIPYELCEDGLMSETMIRTAAESGSVGIFIGPEGGFERSEIEKAMSSGAVPISLGKRILRTETAGMAILSVLMFMVEWRSASGALSG